MNTFKNNYEKNIVFLKHFNKVLYEKVKLQDISHLELMLNEKNEINIKHNGHFIYPEYGSNIINKQVDSFLKKPNIFFHPPFKNHYDKVAKYSFKMMSKIENKSPLKEGNKLIYKQIKHPQKKIPFLILLGIGSGEYIEKILEKKEVLNLLLVDKDYAFFKLSLHLMDWTKIFQKFSRKEGSFNFFVGTDSFNLSAEIINYIYRYNPMYTFYFQYFTHLNSEFFTNIKNTLAEKMFHAQTGWGFFEDERISLQHTLSNIKNTNKIYRPSNKSINKEVFIIGAGPSIDEDIEKIKLVQENVFIISCGSAIRTLWKNNIKPDFHIETERNFLINKMLSYVDKDYLKNITLVGLNVLHPKVKKNFKNYYLLTRDNDTGSSLFDTSKESLLFTNPTAVNCAFNLAFSLRFKNIYLFGIDNGFKDPSIHHSKSNVHSDKDVKDYKYKRDDFHYTQEKYKGNFGEEFFSTPTYLWCKQRIENCINFYKKKGVVLNVYNCSDGLYIEKTKPLRFEAKDFQHLKKNVEIVHRDFKDFIPLKETIKIKQEISRQKEIFESVLSQIEDYNSSFKLESAEDVIVYLDYVFSLVRENQQNSQIMFSFMGLSLKTINSFIYSHLLASTKSEEYNKEFVQLSIEVLNSFINYTYNEFLKIIENNHNYIKS